MPHPHHFYDHARKIPQLALRSLLFEAMASFRVDYDRLDYFESSALHPRATILAEMFCQIL